MGDLTWSHAAGGIIVSASVYVDQEAADAAAAGKDPMVETVARDKALEDPKALASRERVTPKKT